MQEQIGIKLINKAKFWKQSCDLCLILTTVALFYLAFPTGGYSSVTWFALIPVLISLKNQNTRQAFIIGFLAALLGWLFSIWWVVPGLSDITYSSANLIIPFVLLYCCFSALPYAVVSWLHVYLNWGKSIHGAFLSALSLTALVNYTPQILPGNLAHALYDAPKLIQSADIGGVPLVFFIIHSVGFLLATAITLDKAKYYQRFGAIFLAIALFSTNYLYGDFRIKQGDSINTDTAKKLNVAMIQPNIAIKNRTREDWQQIAPDLMSMIYKVTQSEQVDLVILPELPVPVSFQYFDFDKAILNQSLAKKALLLTAIQPLAEESGDKKGFYNTIELIVNNDIQQRYSKQVLLPFGEYLPLADTFLWLKSVFPFVPNYKQGASDTLFTVKAKEHSIKVIPLICYEAVFSDIIRDNVKAGGELLINTSNDAWFGDTAGQKVHLALSTFRSIEYRKAMIRTTNNGISVIIDPYGRQIESSKITPYTRGYSVTTVSVLPSKSFYQQHPYMIKWLILIITAFGIVMTLRSQTQAIKHRQLNERY